MLVRDPRWARSTVDLRPAILERDRGLCRYCGGAPTVVEIDHVWPVARGGRTTMANCVSACPTCNRAKGSRTDWVPLAVSDLPAVGEPLPPMKTRPRKFKTKAQLKLATSAGR
jgi:hypothetical protein